MSASTEDPHYDPIIKDLMKMNPQPPSTDETKLGDDVIYETSIVEYSLQLAELLDLLLNQKLDDTSRMDYEASLTELTSVVPALLAEKDSRKFPDDHLSRILIDNYSNLLHLANLYFNLSLSSHVTKFLVKAFYKLECWEIYHLLQIIPDIEYFLKLVDIEVTTTPFGHIVRPPENLMNFNMRQGFQYPFPFPFYNFSYHTPDPYARERKYAKISIDNYIDIRLKKTSRKRRRPRSWPKLPRYPEELLDLQSQSQPEGLLCSPPILRSQGARKQSQDTLEYQKHHKVFIFIGMSPTEIDEENEEFNPEGFQDDDEYDTDEANTILAEENEAVDTLMLSTRNIVVVPSAFERVLQDAEKKGIAKLTTIHQCRLLDPTSQRPCLKIFYGKNELQRHQEFVHATTKKIYKCTYCEKAGNKHQSYPRHDSLARHIRRKHGITGRENKVAVNLAKKNAEVFNDVPQASGPTSSVHVIPQPIETALSALPETSMGPEARGSSLRQSQDSILAARGEHPSPATEKGRQSSILPPQHLGTSTAAASASHVYAQQPPPLLSYPRGYGFDTKKHQPSHSPPGLRHESPMFMYQHNYREQSNIDSGHGSPQQSSGPLPMHTTTSYPLSQYGKFSQWPVASTQMLPTQRPTDRKGSDEAQRHSSQATMSQGFQKFHFPNNFYPMQPAYGPLYGQEGIYYPVVPGQIAPNPYIRSVVSQSPPQQQSSQQDPNDRSRQHQPPNLLPQQGE